MLSNKEIDKSIARVQATMEIEGFKLNKMDLKILRKVAEGKLDSDKLIREYKNKVSIFTGNK